MEVKSDNIVEIKERISVSSTEVGMDENGNVGIGRWIPANAEVSVDACKIKIKSKISIANGKA